jgi:hypothetical protein
MLACMKALFIKQPFAEMIARGTKKVEHRGFGGSGITSPSSNAGTVRRRDAFLMHSRAVFGFSRCLRLSPARFTRARRRTKIAECAFPL